ncbi:hypothetical protein Acsp02_85100 [Actinoplanes sp. NBRC 103695]|nr:hypothetical protein Acsp02_85100 [Actinoplanes sp. NBRC 103695]
MAAGFEIGVTTVWRYVREAVDLFAATADDLDTVMTRIRLLAYAILDGTLIPIDRVADQKPYYSGKHKRHGIARDLHRHDENGSLNDRLVQATDGLATCPPRLMQCRDVTAEASSEDPWAS